MPTASRDPRDREPDDRLDADPVAPPRLTDELVDPDDPDDTEDPRDDAEPELPPDDELDPPPLRDDADPDDVPDEVGVRDPA